MNNFEIQQPMQVANYLIKRANASNRPISNLHLQKILYFLQAAFLVTYGEPLMSGNFSRWSYGPVMSEVYDLYKENGSSIIKEIAPNISFSGTGFLIEKPKEVTIESFNDDTRKFLESTSDILINESPWNLVNITHEQEIWSNFEEKINVYLAKDYTNEEISNQFINNTGDQIWQQA